MQRILNFKVKYGDKTLTIRRETVRKMRIAVRQLLDSEHLDYASVIGFDPVSGEAVYISGVRSTKMKHFAVATATRG